MILRKFKKLFYLSLYFFKIKKNNFNNFQDVAFEKINLNRKDGLKVLNKIRNNYSFLHSEMSSEHQVIFSSISQNKNLKINKILEIGTFDGSNALLLSKLFPNTKILTIDLPDDSREFRETYGRNKPSKMKIFIEKRDNNLKLCTNVKFKQMNSIKLTYEQDEFDLIWIDGAHGYPFVTFDILNSLRLSNQNVIIMCDDVILSKVNNPDSMYFSNATINTLDILQNDKIIKYDLLLKRLEIKYNYFPEEQKFIAFLKKL